MRFQTTIMVMIVLLAVVQHVYSRSIVESKMNDVPSIIRDSVPESIFGCIAAVWDLGHWTYDLVMAIYKTDFQTIIALAGLLMAKITTFRTECGI